MREKIHQIFLNSDITIKSINKLYEYIDFCLDNNQLTHTKFKTNYHHILPKANDGFPQFSNLKENPWNGTYLTENDHFLAHEILCLAVNIHSQYNALKLFSKYKSTLNNEQLYNIKMEQALNYSKWSQELIEDNGIFITNAMKISNKMVKSRSKVNKDTGLTSYESGGKNISKALNKKSLINGIYQTPAEYGIKKACKTRSNMYWDKEQQILTNIDIEGSKKSANTKRKNGKYYKLLHINLGVIIDRIFANDLRNISKVLYSKTKENYLGSSPVARGNLNKRYSSHLIGLYVEEISKDFI